MVRADLLDHRSRMVRAKAAAAAGESERRNASSAAAAAHDHDRNREVVTSIGVGKAHHQAAVATCTSFRLLGRKEVGSVTWTVREEDRILHHGERGTADGGSLEAREVLLLRSDAADCDSSNGLDAYKLRKGQ